MDQMKGILKTDFLKGKRKLRHVGVSEPRTFTPHGQRALSTIMGLTV